MRLLAVILLVTLNLIALAPAGAQLLQLPTQNPASAESNGPRIVWEVRNRFRLFREERDFQLQVEAMRAGRSIFEAENILSEQSDGRGWARNTVTRLCADASGRVTESCTRDNVKENYFAPLDHRINVRLSNAPLANAQCAWTFDDGDAPQTLSVPCTESVNLRVRYGRVTKTIVDITAADQAPLRLGTDIAVRDVFVAGMGDSIASGEGNPDKPVALANDGFCFRSYLSSTASQYFRPGRAGFAGNKACDGAIDPSGNAAYAWQRRGAQWMSAACHRSLYSYQTRAALALAIEHPHIAITYLPLACTGATVDDGLIGSQRARECLITPRGLNCPGSVSAQIEQLRGALALASRGQSGRKLDMLLLTIGANDIDFSGLVADIIIEGSTERAILRRGGVIGSVEDSRAALVRELPQRFAKLRAALKPLVGGDLSKVVYVSYGHPALAHGQACNGGRDGFDVHPAFGVNERRLSPIAQFVQDEFLPQIKALATCTGSALCRDPQADAMTFVDRHQAAFAQHGVCVRASNDPDFDRECFSPRGESFHPDPVTGAVDPLVCGRKASDYRPYLPRARWIRSANDSYFSAMTFPQGLPGALQPADIHDATWGILSAVYGGAIHPTAQGHAAMADAALPAARITLGLDLPASDATQILPAPALPAPSDTPTALPAPINNTPSQPPAPALEPRGEIAPRPIAPVDAPRTRTDDEPALRPSGTIGPRQ